MWEFFKKQDKQTYAAINKINTVDVNIIFLPEI